MIRFAFFLSGAAALLYEVLWVRLISLFCGHTTLAVSAVLSAFMAGLALGSRLGGRTADRVDPRRLVAVYAGLETLIAASALLTRPAISWAGTGLLTMGITELPPFAQAAVFFSVSFLLLLVPTTFMGATFPVLIRWESLRGDSRDRPLAALYGINTFGAVVGSACSGFLLLPLIGSHGTLLSAAAINLLAAAAAWVSRGEVVCASPHKTGPTAGLQTRPILLLAMSGTAAMICQVAWTRVFMMVLGSTTYAFTVMLTTFLIGIGSGSLAFARFRDRLDSTFHRLSQLICATAFFVFAGMWMIDKLPYLLLRLYAATYIDPDMIFLVQFSLCALVMLPPTLLMGAALPWTIAAARPAAESIGAAAGGYYAANTTGAIAGSAAAGLLLVPYIGAEHTLLTAVAILAAAALYADKRAIVWLTVLAGGVMLRPTWDAHALSSGIHVYAHFYHSAGRLSYADYREKISQGHVLFHKSGRDATISVLETDWGARYLRIDGKTDASETGDMGTQLLVGYLPMLLHPGAPARILAVGLGSGMTAGALATNPRIQRIEALEIEPVVTEAARYFTRSNHAVLDDPRLRVSHADARQFMAAPGESYDIITSEPSNPWIAGIASLFTREAFSDVRRRLTEDGIFCQWFHSYFMTESDFKMVLRTFSDVFPHVMLFSNGEADYFLMGSLSPWRFDFDDVRRAYQENDAMRGDFQRLQRGLDDPFTLLARTFVLGDADFRRYAQGAALHTDDKTSLEFSGPRNFHVRSSARIIQELTGAKTTLLPDGLIGLKPEGGDWAKVYAMTGEGFLRTGEPEKAEESFNKALRLDPSSARARTGLGILREEAGDVPGALSLYLRALDYPRAHARLGALYAARGENAKALQELETALELLPEDPFASLHAARVYRAQGAPGRSRALIENALRRPVPEEDLLKDLVEMLGRNP